MCHRTHSHQFLNDQTHNFRSVSLTVSLGSCFCLFFLVEVDCHASSKKSENSQDKERPNREMNRWMSLFIPFFVWNECILLWDTRVFYLFIIIIILCTTWKTRSSSLLSELGVCSEYIWALSCCWSVARSLLLMLMWSQWIWTTVIHGSITFAVSSSALMREWGKNSRPLVHKEQFLRATILTVMI